MRTPVSLHTRVESHSHKSQLRVLARSHKQRTQQLLGPPLWLIYTHLSFHFIWNGLKFRWSEFPFYFPSCFGVALLIFWIRSAGSSNFCTPGRRGPCCPAGPHWVWIRHVQCVLVPDTWQMWCLDLRYSIKVLKWNSCPSGIPRALPLPISSPFSSFSLFPPLFYSSIPLSFAVLCLPLTAM